MRGNEMLDKMGLVDPAFVEAADQAHRKEKYTWVKWGVLAAGFALILYGGIRHFPRNEPIGPTEDPTPSAYETEVPQDFSQLPLLTISEHMNDGMGFEGYSLQDISELVNANPWNEDVKLSTLPVFKNPLTYDEAYHTAVEGVDYDKMEEFLLEIAARLGLDADDLTITDNAPSEEEIKQRTEYYANLGKEVPEGYLKASEVIGKANGVEITVDQKMIATIRPASGWNIPNEYTCTLYGPYEELVETAEYFGQKYSDLLCLDKPQANVTGGSYSIRSEGTNKNNPFDINDRSVSQSYTIGLFEGSGTITEQIIHYNFHQINFSATFAGISSIQISQPDLSQKVGDYPIMTVEEAKEMLAAGKYITTVPYEVPDMAANIAKVELVYRNSTYHDEYFMPYYKFYIKLPIEREEDPRVNQYYQDIKDTFGLDTYGAFYVPAVEEEFLSDVTVWDGNWQ